MGDNLKLWLTEELNQHGWSHKELAKRAGISRPFVSRILSGDIKPSVNFCHKVALALNEPPEKLLRLAGILPPAPSDNPTVDELTDIIKNLSPEAQKELLDFAQFKLRQNKNG